MSNDVHFSSATDEWATPDDFFNELNNIFRFNLDACATDVNTKCSRYFTREDDALRQKWTGTVFMNPPYGREISKFMAKAYLSSVEESATVVCLVPARTDTRWWHDYATRGQILYLRGRLKFGNAKSSAPFPSALVIFWGGKLAYAAKG